VGVAKKGYSVEVLTALYFLSYFPYIIVTRYLATVPAPALGRALTGLEILPSMLIVAALLTYLFSWQAGWFRNVHRVRLGGIAIPFATRYTFLSGLCTAVIIVSVPLSYTLTDVSIPLIQLLMRGDILIIAPLVDLLAGRRVRWWSVAALVLVAIGMAIAFAGRGSISMPPTAIGIIAVYTAAYFGRLMVMTKIAKDGNPDTVRTVFLEEKIVGFPVAIAGLALLGAFGGAASQGDELRRGFVEIWTMPSMPMLALCGLSVFATGIFSTFILLDARENSFCVPLERSASVLAGTLGAVLLAFVFAFRMPSAGEFAGAGMLVAAIVLLTMGPRWSKEWRAAAVASGETKLRKSTAEQ
jgi:hypothetical protein